MNSKQGAQESTAQREGVQAFASVTRSCRSRALFRQLATLSASGRSAGHVPLSPGSMPSSRVSPGQRSRPMRGRRMARGTRVRCTFPGPAARSFARRPNQVKSPSPCRTLRPVSPLGSARRPTTPRLFIASYPASVGNLLRARQNRDCLLNNQARVSLSLRASLFRAHREEIDRRAQAPFELLL